MISPDQINAIFIAIGSFVIGLSCWKLYKDKIVRGVSAWHVGFFTAWCYWDLYFWPHLGVWFSFASGVAMAISGTVYMSLILYYMRREGKHAPTRVRDGKQWCETYTGKQFWLLEPDADSVDPRDVAHGLAYQCRYNGHVANQTTAGDDFYSVAEHCCLLSDYALHQGRSAQDALQALLHDAPEAYSGDIPRPWKNAVPALKELERELDAVVIPALGGLPEKPAWLDELDLRIILDERAQARSDSGHDWYLSVTVPLGVTLKFWDPTTAEHEWLKRYRELCSIIGLDWEVS